VLKGDQYSTYYRVRSREEIPEGTESCLFIYRKNKRIISILETLTDNNDFYNEKRYYYDDQLKTFAFSVMENNFADLIFHKELIRYYNSDFKCILTETRLEDENKIEIPAPKGASPVEQMLNNIPLENLSKYISEKRMFSSRNRNKRYNLIIGSYKESNCVEDYNSYNIIFGLDPEKISSDVYFNHRDLNGNLISEFWNPEIIKSDTGAHAVLDYHTVEQLIGRKYQIEYVETKDQDGNTINVITNYHGLNR